MTLTIGNTTLSDGTRAQPWRLLSGGGRRLAETAPRIRAADAAVLDRKNRSFTDTVELTRSWESCAAATAGVTQLQSTLLGLAPASLSYGQTARGTAACTACDFDLFGCSASLRITFEGTLA